MGVIWGLKILKGGYLNDMIIEWGGDGRADGISSSPIKLKKWHRVDRN